MKVKKKIASILVMATMVSIMATGCGGGAPSDKSAWDSSNEISVISREDGSGTRGAFVELFGIETKDKGKKVDKTINNAQITNSTSVMMTSVAGDDYSIGYISMGSLGDTVKAIKVDGAEPSAENVKNGNYKIARNFNIALKKDSKNELAKDFINYILGQDGQKIVEDNHFIKLDGAKEYKSQKPEGKLTVGGSSSVSPVMEKLIEGYKKVNANASIELQTTDSTTGMASTIEGAYDIGMSSRELKESELSKGLEAQVIAIDGIAVIVNKNSSVDMLTSSQVKDIYTGKITSWEEVVK